MNTHAPHQDDHTSHLVILGSGQHADHGHALARLSSEGPLLLINSEPPGWQRTHLAGARVADPKDPGQVVNAVRQFSEEHRLAGVLHFDPAHTRAAAAVCREFGLPGPSAATLDVTTVRHRTAAVLERAGADSSGARRASTFDEALQAAQTVGIPLVCKPASPRRRYAARRVEDLAELADAFGAATDATWPGTGAVIEPWLDGIEATAYTLSTAAGPRVVAISHAAFDPEAEPHLVPREVVVDADDVCASAIEAAVARVLAAVGHHHGPAQLRLRITATGPKVITITPHLTDPLLCELIEQVTGIDLITAAGRWARGHPYQPADQRVGAAAVRYLQSPQPADRTAPTGHAYASITPYAQLESYDGVQRLGPLHRSGYLTVSGADYPMCVSRLRTAATALHAPRMTA